MTLGERLRRARERIKMNQPDLARATGIDQQLISKIETGKQKKSTDIVLLSNALGVRPEWLELGHGPMIFAYTSDDPRIIHALKIMESLPPEALDYVIKDIDKTAELIETMNTISSKKAG